MSDLYIGLMSGTSADGIDAALVDFSNEAPSVLATHYAPYDTQLREQILALCKNGENEIERLGELDVLLGQQFAAAVNALLKKQGIDKKSIQAIGSHGQTIRHSPHSLRRFTVQIGDPNTIAAETGIVTIADFRRKDMAEGGQGAPLVPAFHQQVFSSPQIDRAIVNIGGIANVTLLPKQSADHIIGFDTGPGNALMDAWIFMHQQLTHDHQGSWGATGKSNDTLLSAMLSDPYFKLPPPKSTGREYFHLNWLNNYLSRLDQKIAPQDVQATLVELTARSIVDAIQPHLSQGEILVCGGGAHNKLLMQRLTALANGFVVSSTGQHGIDPDWVEAVAFAWLAKQTWHRLPGNLPSVTGASKKTVLGGIYY